MHVDELFVHFVVEEPLFQLKAECDGAKHVNVQTVTCLVFTTSEYTRKRTVSTNITWKKLSIVCLKPGTAFS
jgi:hypothetical protein